ncbi:type II toxin-antitoxin system PemK/MazF family toxin [Clostridium sp. CF012]|uniref:type II toxin-antitoxin system PemK/MazF family toxin n=1 Tax=Clostridium sp. CF012 TaxID=2843319 RepID=UPI001C0D0BCA|nr:type II toxin-antitoxin system PemK/MazF family toxin [Clostridium sp. CF012]MBU3142208.1 type II toxin-antitoxin system PemK/MazF family toxin [Clostridium sp. CF012]
MSAYLSLEKQIDKAIDDIKKCISKNNARVALPILQWTLDKIELNHEESIRIEQCKVTKGASNKPRYVKKGWVYYAKLGKNIGSEQNGFRPVLIVQSSQGNSTSNTVTIIPLTDALDKNGKPKRTFGTHVEIDNSQLKKKSIIKTEHINNISKNRLKEQICFIGEEKMNEVDEKLKISLGLK